MPTFSSQQLAQLSQEIQQFSQTLGFQQVGISDINLSKHEAYLNEWIELGLHGEMAYMARHGSMRSHPEELVPGTLRVISLRMDYLPPELTPPQDVLRDKNKGYISRYALGRDYHKLIRKRLQQLADKIQQSIGEFGYRVFTDSAPVLEKALAEKASLGWMGKHTNLINRKAGSWFFLGEIFTDLPLPVTTKTTENHCGKCTACIDICPTQAIIAPYKVDAKRCISYLTIELHGSIPVEFRADIGNRIYGCDDCQLVCPWNRFAKNTNEKDFFSRHRLDCAGLLELFNWDEAVFLKNTEGSAIRRIGYERWQRNIAIALGNSPKSDAVISALNEKHKTATPVVQEHIEWALQRQAL
ncbi:MAG: tRNA epoxyqueuosine(34) reductase QueG [Gammaproteobacteria bacterium]|nr:tRNA epoxyqueuosine(34) reductase QueG [Gammaproteobacteria bacterium]